MTRSPILDVRNVSKHFPISQGLLRRQKALVRAVDGVSFTLGVAETLALVGESGCGKTTLARMLLNLLTPTDGTIAFNGKPIQEKTEAELRKMRTEVQAVFQDPWASLSPRMKVFDIVAEPLVVNERLTKGELTSRVDEALTMVGLRPDMAQNFPHEFSGGQRQRIAIASAIIGRPKLMILDEPVSALDVSIRSQIMNLFKDLQDQLGCSYVVVAHDLGTTRFMADHIAVMYLGKIVEIGPTDDLFDRPAHPYTEALLSAALPVRIDTPHEPILLKGEVPSPLTPPSGCHFHPRCHRFIGDQCRDVAPVLHAVGANGHCAACHLMAADITGAATVRAELAG